jgi:hypothetical protein
MKRSFFIILINSFLILVLSGCGDKTQVNENESVSDESETEDINGIINDDPDGFSDQDVVENDNPDDCDPVIPSDWIAPDPEWESWGYLRMTGEIADPEGEYVGAVYTEGRIKTTEGAHELTTGSFLNSSGLVISAEASSFKFVNMNESEKTATVDYYNGSWQFNKMIIPLAQKGESVVDFGAFVIFTNSMVDVKFDSEGAINDQRMRKKCLLAVSTIEDYEQDGEIFEMPVGGIYGCFEGAADGSVGETLKMMFRNELTDKREDLLKWINTQEDGSVLEYGDEGFQFECVCYEENGIDEVPCWQYDGPGGAEECPPEVPEGECHVEEPDDDLSDEVLTELDEVNDESNEGIELPDQE